MLGIPWIIFFIFRKDLRKEMVVMSFLISLLAITEIWFYGKYWQPIHLYKIFGLNLGFEDFLICFFYGGVGSVSYQFIKNIHYKSFAKFQPRKLINKELLIALFIAIIVLLFLESTTNLNLVITSGLAQISFGVTIIIFRKDLFVPSLFNGIILSTILFVIAIVVDKLVIPGSIGAIWQESFLFIKLNILNYPLDDLLWHFTLGFGIGSIYEVYYALKDEK